MAEVEPMKIDVADGMEPKSDGSDQKKRPQKRKRLEPCSYTVSPAEKEAKIDALRNEINSLVRFSKDLAFTSRRAFQENVDKVGSSPASLNCAIACLMEESDLPLSILVDDIFEKVKGRIGNGENVTRATVKSNVLMIGQRLSYGVAGADADILEDDADSALWCWETRDLKVIPKSERVSLKVCRTCRRKIQERITAVTAMINALDKSEDCPNYLQDLAKASEKVGKVLNEADIRLLMENMSKKNSAEMAEKDVKKEEKMLIKQMEKDKQETEKAKKKRERELQKEMLQNEKEQKRLRDEAEKEQKRREKEEHDMQKQLKRQQEEAEKEQKRKAKEEAELKKQLAVQKQASLMEQFLKRKKSTPPQKDSSSSKATTSSPSSDSVERESLTVTAKMDSVLVRNAGIDAEDIWKSHLNSWRCIGNSISRRKVHWSVRQKPKTELVKELKLTINSEMPSESDADQVEEKDVCGPTDPNIDGRQSQISADSPLPQCERRKHSMQLLQFDKSHRPPFYGVWPRKSRVIGGRCPFRRDPDIDYEIDSDEEWEEEEPGESLSDCEKDEEDESMAEQQKVDDGDESEDGFFVPDGYLSENEGVPTDEMECDELVEEARSLPDSKEQVQSEEFCTLIRRQKYLNNMTEHALKKNQPLIILNLMHEKTALSPAEELTGSEKIEKMCLQALCICPFPDLPAAEISIHNDEADKNVEDSSNKSSSTPPATAASIPDSDLPQIISIISSCPYGITKIVDSLHSNLPSFPKSQLNKKVREISEFSENRWQVKKEILDKYGISISPERKSLKSKSIASFFTKRCLPPSKDSTMKLNETSPQPPQKHAAIVSPQQDCLKEH